MSAFTASLAQSTISDTAQVKYHEGHKAPPTMLPGRVTPALLLQWEEHAIAYFDKAKTPEAERVSSVLTCWRDSEIDNFIKMHKPRFRAVDFTFAQFMAEIRKRFLDPLWQNNIMRNVVDSKMEPSESFSQFANRVIAGNNLLEGTDIRLDTADLRKKLLGNMSDFLASKLDRLRKAERDRISEIESFEEWMAEVVSFDREATSDLKRIAEMLRNDTSFKRQRLDDSSHHNPSIPFQPSQVPNIPVNSYRGTGANAIHRPPFPSTSSTGFSQSNTGRKRCPPLTPIEISLLNKHKGCRKCRRFYVPHKGADCPHDFPDGATYIPLTEEVAYEAMRKQAIASTYSGSSMDNTLAPRVPSVPPSQHPQQSSSSFSNAYNNFFAPPAISYSTPAPSVTETSSAQIEEVTSTTVDHFSSTSAPAVGAVLPSSSYEPFRFTLSEESDTADDVSPLSVPHLL
jgi:hypothetical protein